ncbi:MAG TPA: cytochrome c [Longimicrobiales bacterium]|nr:cytochrome c [Longimicrobiales bacterium]
MRFTVVIVAALGLVSFASLCPAQETPDNRSTMNGVYTSAQAARGQDTYANACLGCHTPASHTGPAFLKSWVGRPLLELFGYLSAEMPKSEPGSLSPQDYAQVIAYLLKLNGVPDGPDELPADTAVLKTIRFDTTALSRK